MVAVCGRFVSTSPPDDLARYFAADPAPEVELAPSWNVAPTDRVAVVLERRDERLVEVVRWGLVPPWAKDLSVGARMINARAETVATRSAFRKAFAQRRCIVPAAGFYEWTRVEGHRKKQPWFIHRPDGEPYAFAGLWERWKQDDDHPWVLTCTIITGAANGPMSEVHDRMPVMLPPDRWARWLDPAEGDVELLQSWLVPAPDALVTFHPVSIAVNTATNEGPELVDAVAVIDPDGKGPAAGGPQLA